MTPGLPSRSERRRGADSAWRASCPKRLPRIHHHDAVPVGFTGVLDPFAEHRAISLPIRCQGSTSVYPVSPARLWPEAARDGSARGGYPVVAAGSPEGPPALGIACLERTAFLCVMRSQDFLLSSGRHMRYTYDRAALPIPTPSSARHIGIGRVGDDL